MDKQIKELENDISNLQIQLLEKQKQLQEVKASLNIHNDSINTNKRPLTNNEISRYSRQMIIDEIGVTGQLKLKNSSFLIVGAGGLGCPVLTYLVRAGVLNLGIVDYDTVDINNLHRQILYNESCIGQSKVQAAKQYLLNINSNCNINIYNCQLNSQNALEIIQKYDIILDCSDNVATRYLLNDASILVNKPLVSGSALKLEGQLTVYNYQNGPCYRCIFPKPPNPQTVTNCADGGVLGAVTGTIGTLQALEAIKIVLNYSDILNGRLLIFDGSRTIFRNIKLRPKNPNCLICSETPSILQLIDYEEFCGMKASDKDFKLTILNETERITVQQYSDMLKKHKNMMLIDVRNPIEYEICHLDNSINIPLKDILEDKYFNKILEYAKKETNNNVLLLCRRGNDSQLAVQHLRNKLKDFTIPKDIIGGLYSWQRNIDNNFPLY